MTMDAMNGGAFVSADDAETFHHFGLEGISVSRPRSLSEN
jgi:hypothetical protein